MRGMWTVCTAAPKPVIAGQVTMRAVSASASSGCVSLCAPRSDWPPALPRAWMQQYEIVSEMPVIGQGAYGIVFQVRQRKTLQPFACKVMQRHFLESRGMGAQILAEIQAMQKAAGSCRVVRLHGVAEENGCIFLLLELCLFGNLQHALSAQPKGYLPEDHARRYVRHLLQGLMDLHSFGILHRDIKIDNLLVTTGAAVKITDFGWATTSRQLPKDLAGSFQTMAPEVLRGEPQTAAIDVWSAGAVMFHLVVGCPLIHDPNTGAAQLGAHRQRLLLQIQRLCPLRPAARPEHVSEPCWDLLTRLLAPAAAQRPSAQEALQHRWLLAPESQAWETGSQLVPPRLGKAPATPPTASPSSTPRSAASTASM
eukprot:TRINITY_DN65146_c0_g1_i1.p1 TRINITY_DN65146_c0_g1~~TRINITY_DN65146_c0_g1_i1.p1  ORF type:complete len:368 (+),score=61.85 TRINITY_DN65146_c0_g1_i1:66-1169(+)